jgi:hypothetical protein
MPTQQVAARSWDDHEEHTMKRFVLGTAALALLSGIALTASAAGAAPYGYGRLTPYERAAITRSQANLNALKWRVRADGRVTLRERMRINAAQARHNALVYSYRHS